MSLAPGTKLGRYEIRSKIGAGGMGEVYRARDEKLNRDVAIKVLPAALSENADRINRFEQEARAAGTLNHANILAVYDFGVHGDASYVVSELLEGDTLRDLLDKRSLITRKAVEYAVQLTDGLATAHDKGIVHRDLKPENLFITRDDRLKILDFGLAKLLQPPTLDVPQTEIETRKVHTDPGTVMGTVGYMSPEQVRGQTVDQRSDIFSFGAILYEMLSGQRAFRRDTAPETLTAILKEEPTDLSQINGNVNPSLEKIVRRCLEKQPARRFQTASDLGFALEALSTPSGSQLPSMSAAIKPGPPARLFPSSRLAWIVAAVLFVGLLATLLFAIARSRQPARASAPIVRYNITAPGKSTLGLVRWPAVALSPDGSTLAFVATTDGVNRLYVRKRDEIEARVLPGTEGAAEPVFSPNGRWIAFIADFTLKKVQLDGPVTSIVKVADARGVSWTSDDTLIYAPGATDGLSRISGVGGTPQEISKIDHRKNERTHRWPQVLPNGKAVLFTVGTLDSPDNYEQAKIEALILATGERRAVLEGASMARYVPTGHLVFARGGGLYAIGFNPDTLTTSGAAEPILQGVAGDATTGAAQFSIAHDGTMAYVPGGPGANQRRLFWVDRSGNFQPIDVPPAQYNDIRISPDGSRVALLTGSSGSGDVWIYDFGRATSTRFTFNVANASPVWSADGKNIFYTQIDATKENRATIMRKPADGSREAEAVTSIENSAYLKAIMSDGASAIVDYKIQTDRADIGLLSLAQGSPVSDIINTPFNDYAAALSSDNRWLAYQSNESGRPEIYVRDMSAKGARRQVTTEGGEEPHWSRDGRELYYRNNNSFMSVPIETTAAFQSGKPVQLFRGIYDLRSNSGVSYDVDPKGGRFLMIRLVDDVNPPTEVRVVLNWFDELRRLVPPK